MSGCGCGGHGHGGHGGCGCGGHGHGGHGAQPETPTPEAIPTGGREELGLAAEGKPGKPRGGCACGRH